MAPITRARSQESSSEDGLEGENTTFDLKEDPSFWKENNIQVVIRVRPLNQNEISQQGYNKCIKQDSCQSVTWVGHPESRFTFDLVADEHVTQENLFKAAGIAMVDNCMEGYNSCMFAYGQTGSGKTHTMLGDIENGMRRHNTNCGMTPRVFEYLFHRIQKEKEVRKEEKVQFTCKCSFLEIYNEQIFDLLDPNSTNLQIREDLKKGVHVENLKEHEVTSATEAMQQLIQGAANRKVAATNMNRASSRSHSIFTCAIESKWEVQGIIRHRFARLNLVDLAGSERQKSSGAEGERLKEATNINKSLSTLGLVIMNLVEMSNKKSVHVPYRDSKLTFLLQDSLGGNSKTTIIANISPSNCSALETLSTLKFAQRAKFIKNNAIVNEDASGDVISMRLQIQQLKKELAQLRNNGAVKHENEVSNNSAFDSPCMLKLEGSRGNFSPLTFDKRLSQKKEFEVALVAAIRREKEKEASLKALDLAKRTAQDLAEQRENEIKGLKMVLKFRESRIKSLEAVSKGKLSFDSHLSSENEELKREIESLKCQLERNPAVTKFANENLQLKEQIIRLKSFVEEGERERMDEQITVLQDKLLEALDWKLMHEKGDAFNLEPSGNEENEFLQLQVIQNAGEIESLKKKLNLALEENKNLHMRVAELSFELEGEKSARISKQEEESKNLDAESELKTLVEAIANASQKEAEAHEKTIKLTKENEELKLQLGAILEDSRGGENEKLELQLHELKQENEELMVEYEDAMMEKEKLRLQICAIEEDCRDREMQNGYEEMMVKYENVTREKEDLRLQISAIGEDSRGEKEKLEAQLIEMNQENEEIMSKYENAMRERDDFMRLVREVEMRNEELVRELEKRERRVNEEDRETGTGSDGLRETVQTVGTKLAQVQDKLSCTNTSTNHLVLVEKVCYEINELSRLVPVAKESVQPKLVQLAQYNNVSSHKIGKKNKLKTKISVLVSELEISSSTISSLMEKEDCIKTNINEVRGSIESKNEELRGLNARKEEIKDYYKRASENEIKLRGEIENLKPSLNNAENMKKEREVLLEVNHVNRDVKIMDILKQEMDLNKLVAEMKNLKDQLIKVKKEISGLTKSKDEVELNVRSLEAEIRVDSLSLEESEREREKIMSEIERVKLTGEGIKGKIESILPDYQEAVFELGLNLERIRVCEESVREEKKGLSELESKLNLALERMRGLLVTGTGTGTGTGMVCVSESVAKKIEEVQEILNEAKCLTLLDENMMVC